MNTYTVTAYYDLTSISAGIYALTEEDAEEQALELFADQWGTAARDYDHIETRQQ